MAALRALSILRLLAHAMSTAISISAGSTATASAPTQAPALPYYLIGTGSCLNDACAHGAHQYLSFPDTSPGSCYAACDARAAARGQSLGGFDTRPGCLCYYDSTIVSTKHSSVAGCESVKDDWSDGVCYAVGQATPSPTASPTPAPPPAQAVGDPHMQNIHGERFDLMAPGRHVLINIPRGERVEQKTLLRLQADARRLGRQCAQMYFQDLNVTGSWAYSKQARGFHYSVSQSDVEAPKWMAFGKVELKIVRGHTDGDVPYLNVYVKHLGRSGFSVGGLLGEDDHSDVSTPTAECMEQMSLQHKPAHQHSSDSTVASTAEGTFA